MYKTAKVSILTDRRRYLHIIIVLNKLQTEFDIYSLIVVAPYKW